MQCSDKVITLTQCNETETQQKWSFEEYTQLYWDIKAGKQQNTQYTRKLNDFIKDWKEQLTTIKMIIHIVHNYKYYIVRWDVRGVRGLTRSWYNNKYVYIIATIIFSFSFLCSFHKHYSEKRREKFMKLKFIFGRQLS